MRFAAAVFIILVLNYLLGLILPWWIIAIVGFISGYMFQQTPPQSFLSAFVACFVLWSAIAFFIDVANEQVLSTKIAALFGLPQPWMIIILTGFVGGLVTGMGALTGALLRKLMVRKRAA